jgi:hypothetical protein
MMGDTCLTDFDPLVVVMRLVAKEVCATPLARANFVTTCS